MDSSEFEDFKNEIPRNGYDMKDFELNKKDLSDWKPDTVVKIQGTIHVKRKSTGKQKTYKTGHGTTSGGDFGKDLQSGFFD